MSHRENKKVKSNYERKKRLFSEFDEISDEDILEENLNSDDEAKKSKTNKNMKIITNNSNFQTLQQMRMMKKFHNKENNILSNDQIEFAKKIIEQKLPEHEYKENKNCFKNLKSTTTNNFSIDSMSSNPFEKNINHDALYFIGLLCSSDYKITEKKNLQKEDIFSLSVLIEKTSNEKMKFILNFRTTGEDQDYVEYIPEVASFRLIGEDEIFKDELEVHKDDLGKMMKRLLIYKFEE